MGARLGGASSEVFDSVEGYRSDVIQEDATADFRLPLSA
jgi:hypothetical protein